MDTRERTRHPWWFLAWMLGIAAAATAAILLARLAGPEVASLAATTDFAGRDNVFFGMLFGQGAVAATLLARGRAPVRRRRQLVAIGLGLLAIASLLFGARGVIFMLLLQVGLLASFPRKGHF